MDLLGGLRAVETSRGSPITVPRLDVAMSTSQDQVRSASTDFPQPFPTFYNKAGPSRKSTGFHQGRRDPGTTLAREADKEKKSIQSVGRCRPKNYPPRGERPSGHPVFFSPRDNTK